MSLAFACPCGARYKVGADLAGKKVCCKTCGQPLRIPGPEGAPPPSPKPTPADQGLDVYGLDDAPAPSPSEDDVVVELVPRRPESTSRDGNIQASGGAKGLLDLLPRGADLAFVAAGVAGLALALAGVSTGGFLAQATLVLLALAAPVVLFVGAVLGLVEGWRQGRVFAVLGLVLACAAYVIAAAVAGPAPTSKGPVATLVAVVGATAALAGRAKRPERFRRPFAVAAMGMLFAVGFAAMLGVVRQRLGLQGLPDVSFEQPNREPGAGPTIPLTLPEARKGFVTKVVRPSAPGDPLPEPPPSVFEAVRYDSPVGPLGAYVTPDPGDGARHPAIVWITGGDCNTIGDSVWKPADPRNDQTAAAYRQAGLVMMFPSLRGGNDNPGVKEGYLGEVDDVLAAADFLAKRPYVDPARVYLGGHSSGGTLALLTAASTDRFRAVFAFGPVHDVRCYDPGSLPFDASDAKEVVLRAPVRWLGSVRCPTFLIEGDGGNYLPLLALQRANANPLVHVVPVRGADHFTILAPTNRAIAAAVLRDNGPTTNLALDPQALSAPFQR